VFQRDNDGYTIKLAAILRLDGREPGDARIRACEPRRGRAFPRRDEALAAVYPVRRRNVRFVV
jgi:hypothetical protein